MVRFTSLFFLCFPLSLAQVSVLTYHNDIARTGLNSQEVRLTPATVSSTSFGKQFSLAVDGKIQAQPLYLPALAIPGKGLHNVVFLATEHDSVYAFDADSNLGANAQPLWQVSLLPPNAVTIPSSDYGSCNQITPEIGITATPVIDVTAGTIFIVAASKERGIPVHRLHALEITTGLERPNSPKVIQPTLTNSQNKTITFDPVRQASRPGLLLLKGTVFTSWGSHCDQSSSAEPYYGWVIGFNAASLAQTVAFNVSPNGSEGALWNGGAGPASDGTYVYFATGNGTADALRNFGESIVKMDPATGTVLDFFTPYNQQDLSNRDLDIGSGGFMLFPTGNLNVPLAGVVAGKQGPLYVVDAAHLSGFNATADNVLQVLPTAIKPSYGAPAYFNGAVYYGGAADSLKRFSLNAGAATLNPTPASKSSATFAYPGTTPFISSNGTSNGIVWALENSGGLFKLHAYSAADLTQEIYTSPSNTLGNYVKFTTGTVADGKVILPGDGIASVLTLLTPGCASDASPSIAVHRGGFHYVPAQNLFTQQVAVTNSSAATLAGPISLALSNLPSGVTVANASGTSTCQGTSGAPYVVSPNSLEPGASVTVLLQFSNSSRVPIVYNPVTTSGSGVR